MATGEEIPVRKVVPTTPTVTAQPQALPVRTVKPITPGQIPVRKVTGVKPVSSPVPSVPKENKTADEVKADPVAMKKIRDYMTSRKGTHLTDVPDDELYDTFVDHMRYFSANEVMTVGELRWLYNQQDEGKALAGEAYQVFDGLGNVLTNDGLMGAADGVLDYTKAVLSSPSTYAGALVGKVVVGGATKGAAALGVKAAMEAAKRVASRAALEKAVAQGLTKTAAKEAAKKAGAAASKDVAAKAARSTAIKEAGVATVADAGMSVGQDALYQKTQIEAGVQDEYSALEGAISAVGGLVGGAVSYFPNAMRGTSGMTDVATKMRAGAAAQRRTAVKKLVPAANQMAQTFASRMTPWKDAVANGATLTDSIKFSEDVVGALLRKGPDGEEPLLQKMLADAGIKIENGADDPRVMEQVVEFTRQLPAKDRKDLDDIFAPILGIRFDQMIDVMAKSLNRAGEQLGLSSRVVDNVKKTILANREADDILAKNALMEAKLAKKAEDPHVFEYVQSVWRRALVSHPATTAVNIKGWGITSMFGIGAQIAAAATAGAFGIGARVIPGKGARAASDEALRRSGALLKAQVFKARTLLDPYGTKDAAEEFFNTLPKKYQRMIGESSFGVDTRDAASYGLNPKNRLVSKSEDYVNTMSIISGLKLQDTYTKSLSVMGELDLQTRLAYNKGIVEMLEKGESHLISDVVWEKAIKKGLQDTFSMDYTKGRGHLAKFATLIENLSATPGLGFIFPFGRFMNNAMAFTMQYSPLALVPLANNMIKKGVLTKSALSDLASEEAQMALAKVTVGTMAVAWLAAGQTEKEKQGLAWNQDMDSSGTVINNDNLAPLAAYQVMGRIASLMARGEKASGDELLRDAGTQLILGQLFRDVGIGSGVSEMAGYMLSLLDDQAGQEDFGKVMTNVISFIGGEVASGFMRPLEPVNIMGQLAIDNDVMIDRRQLKGTEKGLANTFRYLDILFNPFFEADENGRKNIGQPAQALTKDGPQREPNPLSKLFGRREEAPITNADRMLAMVNLPVWTQSERTGVPEWDSLIHERITPILERRATALLALPAWKKANQRERGNMVSTLMKDVKKQTRDIVASSGYTGSLRDAQRKWLSKDDDLRIEAKAYFEIEDTPDADLTVEQINTLEDWIKYTSDLRKEYAK